MKLKLITHNPQTGIINHGYNFVVGTKNVNSIVKNMFDSGTTIYFKKYTL